jgi:hypothetical protein
MCELSCTLAKLTWQWGAGESRRRRRLQRDQLLLQPAHFPVERCRVACSGLLSGCSWNDGTDTGPFVCPIVQVAAVGGGKAAVLLRGSPSCGGPVSSLDASAAAATASAATAASVVVATAAAPAVAAILVVAARQLSPGRLIAVVRRMVVWRMVCESGAAATNLLLFYPSRIKINKTFRFLESKMAKTNWFVLKKKVIWHLYSSGSSPSTW